MAVSGVYDLADWEKVLTLLVNVGFDVVSADRYSGEITVHVK